MTFTITIFLAVLSVVAAQDYCNQALCGGKQHIACNNAGNFAARCINPSMVQLTPAQRNLIVRMHNNKRNQVAGGKTKLQPACRMATMQWDNELAQLAALNVKQCQMKHDACRNTNTFKQSGQNLAVISTTGTINITAMLRKSVNMWYNEIKDTTMAQISRYPSSYSGPAIGHFTVMMADRNIRVGCAASTYKGQGRMRSFLMACNYATTNIVNRQIYNSCPTAASGCTSGKNKNFPNLCSVRETFAVNS